MSGAALASPWTSWVPWTDKKGRLHPLRAVVFTLLTLPAFWLALRYALGMLGPRALNELIHGAGYWTIWFLLASLTVTPLKAIFGLPAVVVVRRMVGNAAFVYALVHLTLYAIDQKWRLDVVATEIALRFYLTIGFVALLGLVALGVTSTDGWARRLGKRWKRLHRIVYGIGVLGLIHYTLQTKADVSLPLLGAGIFFWLMLWRMLPSGRDRGPLALLGLTLASAALTLAAEWCWYRFGTKIDPMRVLRSELDFGFGLHPVGQVLVLGLLVLAAARVRAWAMGRPGQSAWFWIALFAAGAWAHELAAFMFGLDGGGGEPDSLDWLWLDAAWTVLLGLLGLLRWRVRTSPKVALIDALGLACVAYTIVLASNGLFGVDVVFATGVAALWAFMAWQTRHVSKLAALTLVPLGALLAYGVAELM